MKLLKVTSAAALLSLIASPAFAHIGVHPVGGFGHGFLHPFSGLDHLLAMVSVGIFAARCGGKSTWLVPLAFMSLMALGGALGYFGFALPYVEPIIAVSVIAMGALLLLDLGMPALPAMVLVGAFALFHGHAHGVEGNDHADFATYAAGFLLATGFLHVIGIAFGRLLDHRRSAIAHFGSRAFGLIACMAGIALLAN